MLESIQKNSSGSVFEKTNKIVQFQRHFECLIGFYQSLDMFMMAQKLIKVCVVAEERLVEGVKVK